MLEGTVPGHALNLGCVSSPPYWAAACFIYAPLLQH